MQRPTRLASRKMRRILEANGMKHVEFEFLVDWYQTGERRRTSDSMRYY